MQFTHNSVRRNVGQPHAEAHLSVLMHLLHQDVGGVVLTTLQLAKILGKTETGLRLAESRYRSRTGRELLPQPLLKNGAGRVWSIGQIAEWLLGGNLDVAAEGAPILPSKARAKPGRPRKSVVGGDLA